MAHVSFHCCTGELLLANYCEADIESLTEAREQAARVVGSLITTPGPEDWRAWTLHVSDDLGDEILKVPFSSIMGHLH